MKRPNTARDIPRLAVGIHRFDPTLYLRVTRAGSRSWVQRIVLPNGRQVDRGLGGWPLVELTEARLIALDNRRKVRAGQDPFADRRRERSAPTFADAWAATLEAKRPGWRDASFKSWDATMRNHVLPRLGKVRVAALSRSDVIACLKAITSLSEAKKARQRIAVVLEIAVAHEWAAGNVATKGNGVDAALPHLDKSGSKNHAAAPYATLPGIMRQLAAAGTVAADALMFAVLTATRSTEARAAEWSEIDLETATWTLPADRMKAKRDHRVPLAPAAVELLRRRVGQHTRLVFAGAKHGKPVSGQSLLRLTEHVGATTHGMRSAFRDWSSEVAKAPREVSEAVLSHVVGDRTERAYARSDLFDRRRELMTAWGRIPRRVDRPPGAAPNPAPAGGVRCVRPLTLSHFYPTSGIT